MNTHDRIKLARQNRQLTQKQLAERMGVSVQAVSQWENGRTTPSVTNYELLSDVLRADFDWLRGGGSDEDGNEVVPSEIARAFGDELPIIQMRDSIAFVKGMNPTNLQGLEIYGKVRPSFELIGNGFAIQLGGTEYFDDRFQTGDILIFDNGVRDRLGDIILSVVLMRDGRYDVILAEEIQEGFDPDGTPSAGIRPLTPSGLEMYDDQRILLVPVASVMIEHRRFRSKSSEA